MRRLRRPWPRPPNSRRVAAGLGPLRWLRARGGTPKPSETYPRDAPRPRSTRASARRRPGFSGLGEHRGDRLDLIDLSWPSSPAAPRCPPPSSPGLTDRLRDVARAIDNALVAARGLRRIPEAGTRLIRRPEAWPRACAATATGRCFAPGCQALRALNALSIAWTGKGFPAVEAPAQDETDEAPGLAVPVESAEAGAEQQERLAV